MPKGKRSFDRKRSDERRTKDLATNEDASLAEGLTVGRNAVKELLGTDCDVEKIYVAKGDTEGSIGMLVGMATERRIPVVEVERQKLDRMVPGLRHQGIIAVASAAQYCSVDDILSDAEQKGEAPLVVVLDGVEDPHNLGAIIRNAECLGAHGIIIPKRRAVGVTPTVARASAGAVSHVKIAKVTNIPTVLEELKDKGLWIYAADMDGESVYATDMKGACAIVLGSEGDGISRLTKERCDFCISIPLFGKVNSMNVSCAAAVMLAEISRQRRL